MGLGFTLHDLLISLFFGCDAGLAICVCLAILASVCGLSAVNVEAV
jgi:hypothetical protein